MNPSKNKLTLAKKLANGRVQKQRNIESNRTGRVFVPEIEEAYNVQPSTSTQSEFFSPLMTRHQRKVKIASTKTSEYFSPVQTRHQRKISTSISEDLEPLQVQHKKQQQSKDTHEDKEKSQNEENHVVTACAWKPLNWEKILQNIREMRENLAAPVDLMGCHQCADDDADQKTQRFHKLIALMLSSQTKDETTYEAMQRLKANYLTPPSIDQMDPLKLQRLLCPVSFYKNKANYIQKVARILIDKYDCDIPHSVEELISLPGVGPKMAHICMATAWNETTGIGVDVHVHRITNRLQWVPRPTKEPEKTRMALQSWLPKELWREVNHLLVGFGQTVCTPVRPHCSNCLNRDICPSAEKIGKTVKPTAAGLKKKN